MNDNKLIAEFMGVNVITLDEVRSNKNPRISSADGYTCDDLQYDTSWDWLIPVVQKIVDLSFQEDGEADDFYDIRDCMPDINHTYRAVVEFIKNQSQ